MNISDRLYGEIEVTESVLGELIITPQVQRLKRIAQFGVPTAWYHLKNYSRFTHSVGVMILLGRLGATLEEQAAGLLHDVSHTAFSHVVDWVVGDGRTENYQDQRHKEVLSRGKIPVILKRYGFDCGRIADHHHFGLLERETPELCADRVDYALREMPVEMARALAAKLRVKEGRMVMADKASALRLAGEFLKLQTGHWGGFEATSRYRLFANVIREAIAKKIVLMKDFDEDDNYVMEKIIKAGDKKILGQLKVLESKSLAHLPKSEAVVYKKFRYIDPLFIDGNKLIRVSGVDESFKQEIEMARRKNQEGVRIAKMELTGA